MNITFLGVSDIDPEHITQDRVKANEVTTKKSNPSKIRWVIQLVETSSPQKVTLPVASKPKNLITDK